MVGQGGHHHFRDTAAEDEAWVVGAEDEIEEGEDHATYTVDAEEHGAVACCVLWDGGVAWVCLCVQSYKHR